MTPVLIRFKHDRRGATAIEYCLIAGFISIAVVVGMSSIGTKLKTNYFGGVSRGLS